ncbi:MAG: galactosyldiacylglycerol synthase, partial [Herminiimonas sp.]|nr:galactosyldiacylglycerol synthase [Herminiimonas sp.]
AADAIRAAAEPHEGVSVLHLDVMQFVPSGFRKLYTDFYIALVNHHPALWGYLYRLSNDAAPTDILQRLRRALERLNTRSLLQAIEAFAPDAIVCTHFLPAEILSRLRGKGSFATPVWVQVTDFDLHRMWVQPHMAGYFAATEEVAFRMRAEGLDAATVHVTGIPVMPVFGQSLDRIECAREAGIDPQRFTLLLMGGGAGIGTLATVAAALLAQDRDTQVIAMAGRNEATLQALQALGRQYPGRLVALGFTDRVERLMACADLAITKPGGLTSSECLAMGLPMIVNAPIPGQEERNADYLLEQGVALKAFDWVTLDYRVRFLLAHPAWLAAMRERARLVGRPDAAGQVLAIVLAGLA